MMLGTTRGVLHTTKITTITTEARVYLESLFLNSDSLTPPPALRIPDE